MLLKSKQALTTRRQKDRTVRDRQPKLLRATWATDQRGPRGKPRPRTDRDGAKRGPPGTAGQTGKPHCPLPNASRPHTRKPGSRIATIRPPRNSAPATPSIVAVWPWLLTLDCTAPHTLRMCGATILGGLTGYQ